MLRGCRCLLCHVLKRGQHLIHIRLCNQREGRSYQGLRGCGWNYSGCHLPNDCHDTADLRPVHRRVSNCRARRGHSRVGRHTGCLWRASHRERLGKHRLPVCVHTHAEVRSTTHRLQIPILAPACMLLGWRCQTCPQSNLSGLCTLDLIQFRQRWPVPSVFNIRNGRQPIQQPRKKNSRLQKPLPQPFHDVHLNAVLLNLHLRFPDVFHVALEGREICVFARACCQCVRHIRTTAKRHQGLPLKHFVQRSRLLRLDLSDFPACRQRRQHVPRQLDFCEVCRAVRRINGGRIALQIHGKIRGCLSRVQRCQFLPSHDWQRLQCGCRSRDASGLPRSLRPIQVADLTRGVPLPLQCAHRRVQSGVMIIDVEFQFIRSTIKPDAVVNKRIDQLRLLPRCGYLVRLQHQQIQPQRKPDRIAPHDEDFAIPPVRLNARAKDIGQLHPVRPLTPGGL